MKETYLQFTKEAAHSVVVPASSYLGMEPTGDAVSAQISFAATDGTADSVLIDLVIPTGKFKQVCASMAEALAGGRKKQIITVANDLTGEYLPGMEVTSINSITH
jgi:hypothetical protein